jgi:hypothetical protein
MDNNLLIIQDLAKLMAFLLMTFIFAKNIRSELG